MQVKSNVLIYFMLCPKPLKLYQGLTRLNCMSKPPYLPNLYLSPVQYSYIQDKAFQRTIGRGGHVHIEAL